MTWIHPIWCCSWGFKSPSEALNYPCFFVWLISQLTFPCSKVRQGSLERCFFYQHLREYAIEDQSKSRIQLCAFWILMSKIWLTWAFWGTGPCWFRFWLFFQFSWSFLGPQCNHWKFSFYHWFSSASIVNRLRTSWYKTPIWCWH